MVVSPMPLDLCKKIKRGKKKREGAKDRAINNIEAPKHTRPAEEGRGGNQTYVGRDVFFLFFFRGYENDVRHRRLYLFRPAFGKRERGGRKRRRERENERGGGGREVACGCCSRRSASDPGLS